MNLAQKKKEFKKLLIDSTRTLHIGWGISQSHDIDYVWQHIESLLKEQEKEYNQNIEELIDIITDMELSKTKPFAIPKNRRGIKNYYLKKYKLLSEKE